MKAALVDKIPIFSDTRGVRKDSLANVVVSMPWKITKLLTTTGWDKAENVTNSNEPTVSIV